MLSVRVDDNGYVVFEDEYVGSWSITVGGNAIQSWNLRGEDFDVEYNAAIDGLESLILAMHCAGMDIANNKMAEAIQTAVDAIANNT
jgi:hypothetical protein